MLICNKELIGQNILSINLAKPIAKIEKVIIDPNKLEIVAFLVGGGIFDTQAHFLLFKDIREHHKIGIAINSADEFMTYDEAIRLRDLIDKDFILEELPVVTVSGVKIGKVKSWSIVYGIPHIFQLVVKRPFWKSFSDKELIIERNMIIDIKEDKIIIEDEFEKTRLQNQAVKQYFMNPFRNKKPQKSAISDK